MHIHMIPKEGQMHVPLKIFASLVLLEKMRQDTCIEQGKHMACLPGIVENSIMMPDAHQGYGFPIGGVAAFDMQKGIISPGGVGFDINCGMRALATSLTTDEIKDWDALLVEIFKRVPVGMGQDSSLRLTHAELDVVLREGARWAVARGMGTEHDLELTEENGCMAGADPEKASARAKKRGRTQLGTLGAGNHFIEIQEVEQILDAATAKAFGITRKKQLLIMIHCGSRGFGHQVCSDYLRLIEEAYPDIVQALPNRDLAYAPLSSKLADDYYAAMCCAMNFAWANRQVIAHRIREAFHTLYPQAQITQIYDMSHNNAKRELHTVEGTKKELLVHRKGAARSFGPHRPEVPARYQETGQPVLIPGSMGTASYILAGTATAMEQSFGTTCHGAGRIMSRKRASELFSIDGVSKELSDRKVHIKAGSKHGLIDEAPGVYKDVHEVVAVCNAAGIGRIVAQLRPVGIIKG